MKKTTYSIEDLQRQIAEKDAERVPDMIRQGVLEGQDNEALKKIFRELMQLRSQAVIDQLAKRSHYFPIEMLDYEIKNHNDKDFVSYVLTKYGKKFRCKKPENANRLFEVACKAECRPMLLFLLGKGLAEREYPRLISGSEKLLSVLDEVKVSALHPDTVVTFFVEAAISAESEKRIRHLLELGFSPAAENSAGMNAPEALKYGIEHYDYGKDKRAQLEKQKDEQGLKNLSRIFENFTSG